MSRTVRKLRLSNKTYPEGRVPRSTRHVCRCSYCTGVDKNLLIKKIHNRELKQFIKVIPNDILNTWNIHI